MLIHRSIFKMIISLFILLFITQLYAEVLGPHQYDSDSNNIARITNFVRPQSERNVVNLVNRISDTNTVDPVWETIKYEALCVSEGDIKVATLMANSILSQPSFKEAVIDFVANKLETPLLPSTHIRNLFNEVCEQNTTIPNIWAFDLLTSVLKDDSMPNAVSVLLFNQGFHSLVTYRIANALWYSERDGLSRYFQSICSRIFGSDIHPACRIGKKCVLASGTGVVIGETAVIGDDCVISHGVTLGGTGKENGDRHPKIGNHVNLGAGSTVLGNIKIGDFSIVNPGAVVTKPVEPFTRVGGVPAKLLSKLK